MGIEIAIAKPIPVVAPDQGYDRAAPQLAVGYRLSDKGDGLVFSASMTIRPYRIVDGVVDMAPESMTRTINVGDVDAEIKAGSRDGQVAGAILAVLAKGLAGMGDAVKER